MSPPAAVSRLALGGKVIAAAASVVVLAASGVMWGFYRQFSADVTHIDAVPTTGQTHDVDGKDQNILLVGNDSRASLTPKELKEVGTTAESSLNTDTMLVAHIPANGRKATVVSLPRDSYVDIPGIGMGRLNSAYADGACLPKGCGNTLTHQQEAAGARKLIETISRLTGLHIDHYVEVGLIGFYRISNVLGGVRVCLKDAAHDSYSGIDLSAGWHTLKGSQALAFVRQRHGLPHGDLDRIRRQQAFLAAVANKILSADTLLNPFKLKRLLDAVSKSLTVDSGLDLVKLAGQMRDMAAGNVTFSTIPTQGDERTAAGADVLRVDPGQVRSYFERIIGRSSGSGHAAAKTVPRGKVQVLVENGTTTADLAGRTATALRGLGFRVTGARNANSSSYGHSEIHYAPGQGAAVHTLSAVIPGGAKAVPDGNGGPLTLILGSDFNGVRTPSTSPAGSTPSQTAAQKECVY